MKIVSVFDLMKAYDENRILINSTLQGKSIENYGDENSTIMGVSVVIFVVMLIVSIGIWIWALVATVTYWKLLPDWAKVVSILGLIPIIPGGPIVTLVVVYIAKQK